MSERHAIPLLSNVETAPQPGELPITIEAFHVALQAEREKVLAELRPTLEREITEHVTAQIERTVAAQVEAHRQALEASFDQRVAAGVAQKVQEILEQWRLSRHRMFGPSSESSLKYSFQRLFVRFMPPRATASERQDCHSSGHQAGSRPRPARTGVASCLSRGTKKSPSGRARPSWRSCAAAI